MPLAPKMRSGDNRELTMITGRELEDEKRAHRAAELLQGEVLAGGRTRGDLLGTVPEIRERYGLGRWACREAIGILEMRGVAELRPGRRGGLVVSAPGFVDLTKLTLLHLFMKRGSTNEIAEARAMVYRALVRALLASPERLARVDPARRGIDHAGRGLAAVSANAAFAFAIEFVETVAESYGAHAGSPEPVEPTAIARAADALYEALAAGLPAQAGTALATWLAISQPFVSDEKIVLPPVLEDDRSTGASKSARRLAMRLLSEIAARDPRKPVDLGSEFDISVRHDANAEIVRQAIRLLEDLGVAAPRRGRNGGLALREPDVSSIIRLIPHLLIQQAPSVRDCFEVGGLLGVETAVAAAARVAAGAPGREEARDRLLGEVAALDFSHPRDLISHERLLLEVVDNSLTTACERGFLFYAWRLQPPDLMANTENPTMRTHFEHTRNILDAVSRGDFAKTEKLAVSKHEFLSWHFDA